MENSVFSQLPILLSFYLILTSGPIFIAKTHQRVVARWWMLFKAGGLYIRIFAKKTWAIPLL